jgi:hypothetical protein
MLRSSLSPGQLVLANERIAFFAAWFLAIAGALNGIGHPLMAVAAGGYFPGLVSSPFVGLACIWLWIRLREATRSSATPERAPGSE